jgi:hypothetical protein
MGNPLSDEDVSNFVATLAGNGISLSSKVERTASGGFGLCLIGSDEVLKLNFLYGPNDNLFVGDIPKDPADFFHLSTSSLRKVTNANDAFAQGSQDDFFHQRTPIPAPPAFGTYHLP